MKPLSAAQALHDQLVAWRRDLHAHPELGLQEHRTAKLVAGTLRELGYTVQEGVAQTGVVGLMENGSGPVVMNRVDMDALPIQEESDASYASRNAGQMHACGHDAHVAIGLGVATLMAQNRDAWQGTLKLIFQPGEEGLNGAEKMVAAGVLENPRPDFILAIHVWNMLEAGKVAATAGPVMAAAESWRAEIVGKGGHAAHPELTIDPLVTAALAVTNLQTVVSRNVGAQETAVVTVGMLRSGDTFNVIPHRAELSGTIRTYDRDVRERVVRRVREVIESSAAMMNANVELTMSMLTPAVVNDPDVAALVRATIVDVLGGGGLGDDVKVMGSEDAAFFLEEIPGCYFFVGSGGEGYPIHHHPRFDIDERSLVTGTAVVSGALRRLLQG